MVLVCMSNESSIPGQAVRRLTMPVGRSVAFRPIASRRPRRSVDDDRSARLSRGNRVVRILSESEGKEGKGEKSVCEHDVTSAVGKREEGGREGRGAGRKREELRVSRIALPLSTRRTNAAEVAAQASERRLYDTVERFASHCRAC